MDLSFSDLSHISAPGFRFLCGKGANWSLEQSSVGHFPLASPFPSTDTHALHRHHSLAAGKTLGTRLNFSTLGKFLLGHFGRGGGTGLWRESATSCAPPCRGSRSSLKAALLQASELPPGVQRATAPPCTMDPATPLRLWNLPLLLVGSALSLASVSAQGILPGSLLSFFCCLPGTRFLARLSLGPCLC